jgi:hypothetical protein
MSDFLARLAGRALGVTPVVQPVIAPAFAAVSSTGSDGYLGALAARDPGPGKASVVTAATPKTPEREPDDGVVAPIEETALEDVQPHDHGLQRMRPRPPRGEPVVPAMISIDATATRQEIITGDASPTRATASPANFDDMPPRPASLTSGRMMAPPPAPKAMSAPKTLPEPGPDASHGLIAAPRPLPRRAQRGLRPPAAGGETPQIVRITIGRIDVRAEAASPPAARAASRKQENRGLSLDDYLKQRAEGRR